MEFPRIPSELLERWEAIFGSELPLFLESLKSPLTPSIRVNTLKISVEEFIQIFQGYNLKPVPWCPWGFWVEGEQEERLGNTWEHFCGLFYVQEASSMIPPEIMKPEGSHRVLDMAAAPGSKTTQLAQHMKNQGVIVANDVSVKRIKALTNNLERLGILNTCVTKMDGRRFGRLLPNHFDMALVDAPCSAEGTIRKSYKAIFNWEPWVHKKLAETQRMLLISAYKAVKPGGIIIYSTCTFAPEENEEVVSYLLENYQVKTEPIELPGLCTSPALKEWRGKSFPEEIENCIRVYPHKNEVGGFFVAKLRKLEGSHDGKAP